MVKRSNLEVLNRDTGEVLEPGVFVYVQRRRKVTEGFFMAFQAAFEALAKDEELAGQPMRVLLFLWSRMDYENFILVSQAEVAAALNMRRNRVSEAIAKLVARGIFVVGEKSGRSSSYRLNPTYVWRGSVVNLEKARKEHLRMVVNNSAAAETAAAGAGAVERDAFTRDMFDAPS